VIVINTCAGELSLVVYIRLGGTPTISSHQQPTILVVTACKLTPIQKTTTGSRVLRLSKWPEPARACVFPSSCYITNHQVTICDAVLPKSTMRLTPAVRSNTKHRHAPPVSFTHYPVTAPLSRACHCGCAHDARSPATARAHGPYSSPRTLSPTRPPHLQTTPSSPPLAHPYPSSVAPVSCWSPRPHRASAPFLPRLVSPLRPRPKTVDPSCHDSSANRRRPHVPPSPRRH
jgi:hypothetical protein